MMPVVTCKGGVSLTPTDAGGMVIQAALVLAASSTGLPIEISCGSEGHPPNDPHTLGHGRDVHVLDFSASQILQLIAAIEMALRQLTSAPFTVLYEVPSLAGVDPRLAMCGNVYVNVGASAAHLHIQPRKGTVYPPVQ